MSSAFAGGGWLFMLPLLGASLAVIALSVERFVRFRQAEVDYDDFLDDIQRTLDTEGLAAARVSASETPGPVARVWSVGLRAHRLPFPLVREQMNAAAVAEIARLERHLPHLLVIAQVAPLIGILGTVAGMITSFQGIEGGLELGGGVSGGLLAGGIWKALITTATGLVVAIPALVLHHALQLRVDRFVEALERSGPDLVRCLVIVRAREAATKPQATSPQATKSKSKKSASRVESS